MDSFSQCATELPRAPNLEQSSTILMGIQTVTQRPNCRRQISCRLFGVFILAVAFSGVGSCLAEVAGEGDGLVAHWKFNEGAGDAIKDSSRNGNDGRIIPENAPSSKWGAGEFAGSISFSGDNDYYVQIP